jgi:hypothetical protein
MRSKLEVTNMRHRYIAFLIVFLSCNPWILAQSGSSSTSPGTSDHSIYVGAPFPSLFKQTRPYSFETLKAEISVEDKGASLTYAPFLLTDKYSILSETRFKISQANNLTTIGVGIQYNPVSPRSALGQALFNKRVVQFKPQLTEEFAKISDELRILEMRREATLATVDPGITALTTEIESIQNKLQTTTTLTPTEEAALRKRLAEVEKQRISLLAIAEHTLVKRLLGEIQKLDVRLASEQDPIKRLEINQEIAVRKAQVDSDLGQGAIAALRQRQTELQDNVNSGAFAQFADDLLSSSRPIIGLAVNSSYFSILRGSRQDSNHNGLNDNAKYFAGSEAALTLDLALPGKSQISALFGFQRKRSSAEEGTKLGEALEYAITVGRRVRTLNTDPNAAQDFVKTLFVPSIALGLAVEGMRCSSTKSSCTDGVQNQQAITLFGDFKIRPDAQFRVGFPWKRTNKIDGGSQTSTGVVTLIAFQLGS